MNTYIAAPGVPYKSSKNAGLKYFAVCFLFAVVLTAGAVFNDSAYLGRIPYQIMMFALCSGPFFLGGNNPRHRLLAIFMASYYLIFGMSNFFDLILGLNNQFMLGTDQHIQAADSGMSWSDWVVVIGGLAFLVGYFFISRANGNRPSKVFVRDWKPGVILVIGLLCWAFGLTFSIAYDMVVTPMYIPTEVLGIPLGIASNFRFFSPLGSLMLIYLIARGYKTKQVWPLLILIILTEYVLGFIDNSKEISYRIPVLLMLGLYYLRGSFNKKILLITFLSFIPYLMLFNAYRMDVIMGAQNQTQVQALHNFDKNAAVVANSVSSERDATANSLKSLKDRIDGKVYVDIIVDGTDSGRVPFLSGETLSLFFKTFVPRMFWPDKPESSTGRMFNLAFHLSESKFTYVPTTMLGDLYWNFGMPGVVVGMFIIGMTIAYLASTFSVGLAITLPRFLVLLLATYLLAIRFEGNIALQYSTFLRLVFLIWLMDAVIGFFGLRQRLDPLRAGG